MEHEQSGLVRPYRANENPIRELPSQPANELASSAGSIVRYLPDYGSLSKNFRPQRLVLFDLLKTLEGFGLRSVLFEIFGIPIHGYGLMILVGYFGSVWVASREARRRGLPPFVYDLGLAMLLLGILGGRIFHFFWFYEETYAGNPLQFFKLWEGGLVFYGGAIGGCIGALLFIWRKKLPFAETWDVAAMGAPLAMAFGRVGCYLHGCCFGRLCDVDASIGVQFPIASPAHEKQLADGLLFSSQEASLPVLPVQLFQGAHDLVVFALVFSYYRWGGGPRGGAMPLLIMLYGIGRFALEGLRGDHEPTFTALTVSQNISIAGVLVFGAVFVGCWLRGFYVARLQTQA